MVEVVVAGKQGKVVLQGQCCNPQIIFHLAGWRAQPASTLVLEQPVHIVDVFAEE